MKTAAEWVAGIDDPPVDPTDENEDRYPYFEIGERRLVQLAETIQADAKTEGWREGILAAARIADLGGHHMTARFIRELLPPAPSEGGESGKVG